MVVKKSTNAQDERHTNHKPTKLRVVGIECVSVPDAQKRLPRAVDILLRAAARDASQSKGNLSAKRAEPLGQNPVKDDPTGGGYERQG